MANTSAQLLNYLGTKADIAYATQQLVYWADKYEANNKRLEKQTKFEEQWNNAYDKCYELTDDKTLELNGRTYFGGCECEATDYANDKVTQYDENLKEELAELDMEYETMKTLWEAELEVLNNRAEGEKQNLATAAQDTGLLNG